MSTMTLTRVDAARLRAAYRAIAFCERRWDQGAFHSQRRRGSAHCYASWVCKLADVDVVALLEADPSGETVYATAQELLGLDDAQAAQLLRYGVEDLIHPSVPEFAIVIARVTGVDVTVETD